MNYKNVKKKKKNVGFFVLVSVLVLVLAGGAIAGLGFAFDWWKTGNSASKLPTSTFNVNVSTLEDIYGIAIVEDDFAFFKDEGDIYNEALEEWKAQGSDEANKPKKSEGYLCYGNVILNIDTYGVEFTQPESGNYNLTVKVNGEEYVFEDLVYTEELEESNEHVSVTSDFDGKITTKNIMEGDVEGFYIGFVSSANINEDVGLTDGAFCIMFVYKSEDVDFETLEIVSFELVEDKE